jgi:hypothetical protein
MSVTEELTFVLCIENNAIREQALLLCESIRRFSGRHCRAPIIAVAPRRGLGVDRRTQARLEAMDVAYHEAPLNQICPEYGSANRVFAAAWAEAHSDSEWLVVLDSDTVLLGELALPPDVDVVVRPVDSKGSATEGIGDPFDDYWQQLAAMQGVPLDRLPFIRTTDRHHRIRASYNAGLVVVRRQTGILNAWATLFSRSVIAGLKPWRGSNLNVFASTGLVGIEASEYWGSNQAAAAVAIWATTTCVTHYPDSYNIPLHLLLDRPDLAADRIASPPVHAHYHWLFTAEYYQRALALLERLGSPREHLDWLSERLPLTA